MNEFVTKCVTFDEYNTGSLDSEINSASLEGYDLLRINTHYEPVNSQFRAVLVFKLRPMAAAITGD